MDSWGNCKPSQIGTSFEALSFGSIGQSFWESAASSIVGFGNALQDQTFPSVQTSCFDSMAEIVSGVGSLIDQPSSLERLADYADGIGSLAQVPDIASGIGSIAVDIEYPPATTVFESWAPMEPIASEAISSLSWPIRESLRVSFEPIADRGGGRSWASLITDGDFASWSEFFTHRKVLSADAFYRYHDLLRDPWFYCDPLVDQSYYKGKHYSLIEKKRPPRSLGPSIGSGWCPGPVRKVKHGYQTSRRAASDEDDASTPKRVSDGSVAGPTVMHLANYRGGGLASLAA